MDAAEHPITQSEVQALIEPLCSGIQRMEIKLLELQKDLLQVLAGEPSSYAWLGNQVSNVTADGSGGEMTQPWSVPDSGMSPDSSSKEATNKSESQILMASSNKEIIPIPPIDEESMQNTSTSRLSGMIARFVTLASGKSRANNPKSSLSITRDEAVKGALSLIEHHKIDKAFELFQKRAQYHMTIADRVVAFVDSCSVAWYNITEPERSNLMYRVTISRPFDICCQSAIIANSLLVAYMSDWQIRHVGKTEPYSLFILESSFVILFSLELAVRLGAHRLYFFVNQDMYWNIFDFVLVIISSVDFVVSKMLYTKADLSNVGFMRLLRLMKLARIFRSLRLFRFLKSLAVLLESFQNSMSSLFWGLIMMAFVLYLFALIFIQAFVGYLNSDNEHISPDQRRDIDQNFGSLPRTILSLYSAVTGGEDWMKYGDILWDAGREYGLLFVFFTFFATFAVFNLITGLLVEKAINSSKPDRADQILAQRRRSAQQKSEFMEICSYMDSDKNGKISWTEFQEWYNNPVMMAYMASIGIDIRNVELFFSTVGARHDRGTTSIGFSEGEVSYEAFVEGCMHMKGSATALDMQRTLFEMDLLHLEVKRFQGDFDEKVQRLEKFIGRCFRSLNNTLLGTEASTRFPL